MWEDLKKSEKSTTYSADYTVGGLKFDALGGSLVIAWAGWNPLQLAGAIAAWYLDAKEQQGWQAERLQPLLAALLELLPWLKQWHNAPDAVHGERLGDTYAAFVDDEVRALGLTLADLRAWRPAAGAAAKRAGRRRGAS